MSAVGVYDPVTKVVTGGRGGNRLAPGHPARARRPYATVRALPPDPVVRDRMAKEHAVRAISQAAAAGELQWLRAADQEAAGQPGDDDPPRCPALSPGRLHLLPLRAGAALAVFQRLFGLLHLGDQCVEAHACPYVGGAYGGVTSTPMPFFMGVPALASATRLAASAVDSGLPGSGSRSASSPKPRRANCRRVACIRVCSK